MWVVTSYKYEQYDASWNTITIYEAALLNKHHFMQFGLITDYGVILPFMNQWYLSWTLVLQMT